MPRTASSDNEINEGRSKTQKRLLITALGVCIIIGLGSLYPVFNAMAPKLHDPIGADVKECTAGTPRRHLMVCEYPDGTLRAFDASVQPPRPTALTDQDMHRILAGDPSY